MKLQDRPLLNSLRDREERGRISRAWEYAVNRRGHANLVLNGTKLLKRVHKDSVTWIDLDRVENRYLLSASTDASIAVFDTQQDPRSSQLECCIAEDGDASVGLPQTEPELRPVLFMGRRAASSSSSSSASTRHRFLISCVCWYPVDTGLFVTGSYDRTLKVWDTNCQELVSNFEFPAPVTSLSMSRVATTHCLIAGACQQQHIRLCDPSSGAFTHTISGHREPVWTVCWSARSEFELVSGDCYGQIRVWDIRRSGCVAVLDQYRTTATPAAAAAQSRLQEGHRGPGAEGSAGPGSSRPPGQRLQPQQPPGHLLKRQRCGAAPPSGAPCNAADAPQRAHLGSVTCVLPTPDGLHWLSAGTDSRLRLWDAWTWHNKLVSYPDTHNRATRAKLIALSEDGRAVFHPCDNDIQVFDVRSGQLLNLLRQGHYGAVTCCAYSSLTSELFSGGADGQILVWGPSCPCGTLAEM